MRQVIDPVRATSGQRPVSPFRDLKSQAIHVHAEVIATLAIPMVLGPDITVRPGNASRSDLLEISHFVDPNGSNQDQPNGSERGTRDSEAHRDEGALSAIT
jgi:hypothetical protein